MRKRILFFVVLPVVLVLGAVFAWEGADLPPVRLVLKYGFPPSMAPTGETMKLEGVEFVQISPGYFRMGSHYLCEKGDLLGRLCSMVGLSWGTPPKHDSAECPPHWVEFAEGFWVARTEITNEVYERFDPGHRRGFSSPGDDHPVMHVSWEDAGRFCAWLSEKSGLAIRLPSESEWECACRAGSNTEYSFGDDEEVLEEYAWFNDNSGRATHEVGTQKPNAWGLHDLHGSFWEWCEDTWHDSYDDAPLDGSAWTLGGSSFRVYRGGGRSSSARFCRSALRHGDPPGFSFFDLGFRPAFSGPQAND